jgi:hypothetical protein
MAVGASLMGYNGALNVEASLPLVVSNGQSLCSMQSGNLGVTDLDSEANAQMMERFAVLSVMPTIPAAGTFFRPPYSGTTKPVYLTADVRTDWLPNLTMTSDPVDDQTDSIDYKIDDPTWFGLPHYSLIQPNEKPQNRMAPRYQQNFYPEISGKKIGQIGILAASNHARRVEMLQRIIRHGIDRAHDMMNSSDGIYLSGAGYGVGGAFFSIAVAGHYLEEPAFLELLTRPWESASGNYNYGAVDLTGRKANAFWETTSISSSPDFWAGYDLPKDRNRYPYGPALYGDARKQAPVGSNDSAKDPAFTYHAVGDTEIRYAHGLTTAAGWGGYYRNAVPTFVVHMIAAKLLGVAQYYPGACHDLFYQHINDPKMWHNLDYSANAYMRDVYGFGGTGNEFVYDMWQAHGSVQYNDDPQSGLPAPRVSSTLGVKVTAP